MSKVSDALTMEDLSELRLAISALEQAGLSIIESGFEPTFSVVPLQFVAMRLDYVMPPSQGLLNLNVSNAADPMPVAADAPAPAAEMEAMLDEVFRAAHLGETLPSDAAPTQADLVQDEPEQVGGDAAAAAGEGLAALAPAANPSPQALPAGAAILTPDAPDVAPRPTAGSASALAASRPAAWTPEEDARLVLLVANAMRGGATKGAAIRFAADDLGRPEAGTGFRLHNKLAEALTAALAGPLDPVGAEPVPAPPKPVPPVSAPRVETAAPTQDLTAYLSGLPRKLGRLDWPLARDLELIELSINGFNKQDIAVDMGVDANLIGPRFDVLTGLYRDADDRAQRRYKMRDVQAALAAMIAQVA